MQNKFSVVKGFGSRSMCFTCREAAVPLMIEVMANLMCVMLRSERREESGSTYDQRSNYSRQTDGADESISRPSSSTRHVSLSPSDDNVVDTDNADEDEHRRMIERRRRKHRHCRSHRRHRRGISSSTATRSTWVSCYSSVRSLVSGALLDSRHYRYCCTYTFHE